MRYFGSKTPKVNIFCKSGDIVKFQTHDGRFGVVALDDVKDKAKIACIESCIEQGIGGQLAEITQTDFDSWEKKTHSKPAFSPTRETIGGGTAVDTTHAPPLAPKQPSSQPVVAAAETDPPVAPAHEAPPTDDPPLRTRRQAGAK